MSMGECVPKESSDTSMWTKYINLQYGVCSTTERSLCIAFYILPIYTLFYKKQYLWPQAEFF